MNINPQTLPSVLFQNKETLPNCCGIYFVIDEEDILYIGKSVNIFQRWKAHHKSEMIQSLQESSNFRIAWLTVSDKSLLDETEIALINHFKPRLNGAVWSSKNKKDPDGSVRVRIKADIAEKVREMASNLNMSFLEVIYLAFNTYYLEHFLKIKNLKSETQTIMRRESKESKEKSVGIDINSDDTCFLDLDF